MGNDSRKTRVVRVGNTPLVDLEGIHIKLECTNPTGSIKDRIASYILVESQNRGMLKKGMTIVEATSGNTGIAFAYFGREMGYDVIVVMPENMTDERKNIIRALGAKLVLCSAKGSFAEAAAIRDRMVAENEWFFNPDQFSNPLNVECHYKTTAQEIIEQLGRRIRSVGAFVAGIGTGGTLIGVGKALREINPNLRIVAVEPKEAAVMSGGKPGPHLIQGIGDGFIPAIVSDGKGGISPLIDEVICISDSDATDASKYLSTRYGFCVGVSSGANYLAAIQMKKDYDSVVSVFPDGFRKYESLGLSHCVEGACPYEEQRTDILSEVLSS